ncbi:MAG: hypothetical protein HY906_19370 [Deltaproteobacteria bacterium]|nr:hypothetical protein [Deltaproteobacteria bacterium]
MVRTLVAILAVITLLGLPGLGCGGHGGAVTPDGGGPTDGAAEAGPGDGPAGDRGGDGLPGDGGGDGMVTDECTAGQKLCTSATRRRFCADGAAGRIWQEADCGPGEGCVRGDCVSGSCSDECNLGDVDGAKTCELYDLGTASWVTPAPAAALHDRARAYNLWLRRDGMAAGGVGSPHYADPGTWTDIDAMHGIGDSAIWTGTYLAAEALRLEATGAADARSNVKHLAETLHVWMNVAGQPGLLSRFASPSGTVWPFTIGDHSCGDGRTHCNVAYNGGTWDWIGHISRDQYQGVLLGYALAYEALSEADEATRALIRDDVVELVEELMKERQVPIKLTYNGTVIPQFDVTMRFVVLAPAEMDNGAVQLIVNTTNLDASEMYGFQEFIPNLQDVLKQMPLIGGLVPAIPRASSAIMLASFFRVALAATAGVPAYAGRRAAILDYYLNHGGEGGNVANWLAVAKTYNELNQCGESYYGHNISMEPMYNLARLEDDPTLKATVANDVLSAKMWPLFRATKNSFFSYIYAASVPSPEAGAVSTANTQLAQFPPPPRVNVAVDLRADPDYLPHQSGCTDQVDHSKAVDVGERPVGDFLWQRHPWGLFDAGDPAQTQPGVDYLVAYWMARHHAFLTDDTAGRCLRWH